MNGEETTLSMAINDAAGKGFKEEFRLENGLVTLGTRSYQANELVITKHYRFEGESNPDDMAVLYLIRTNDGNKGIIIDAYGTYSSRDLSDFLKNVKVDKQDESIED